MRDLCVLIERMCTSTWRGKQKQRKIKIKTCRRDMMELISTLSHHNTPTGTKKTRSAFYQTYLPDMNMYGYVYVETGFWLISFRICSIKCWLTSK